MKPRQPRPSRPERDPEPQTEAEWVEAIGGLPGDTLPLALARFNDWVLVQFGGVPDLADRAASDGAEAPPSAAARLRAVGDDR